MQSTAVMIQEIEQDAAQRIAALRKAEADYNRTVAENSRTSAQESERKRQAAVREQALFVWQSERLPALQEQAKALVGRVQELKGIYAQIEELYRQANELHPHASNEFDNLSQAIANQRCSLGDVTERLVDPEMVVEDAVGDVLGSTAFAVSVPDVIRERQRSAIGAQRALVHGDVYVWAQRFIKDAMRMASRNNGTH